MNQFLFLSSQPIAPPLYNTATPLDDRCMSLTLIPVCILVVVVVIIVVIVVGVDVSVELVVLSKCSNRAGCRNYVVVIDEYRSFRPLIDI